MALMGDGPRRPRLGWRYRAEPIGRLCHPAKAGADERHRVAENSRSAMAVATSGRDRRQSGVDCSGWRSSVTDSHMSEGLHALCWFEVPLEPPSRASFQDFAHSMLGMTRVRACVSSAKRSGFDWGSRHVSTRVVS